MEIIVNSVSPLSRWREYTQIYCKWCNNKMNLKLRRESVCWKKTYERFFAFNDTLSFPTNPALVSDAVNFRYREEKIMFTTGDKLLNVMKEEEIGIAELARISGVPERTILDIMARVKEPELGVIIETTKTDAGTRVLPITEDVAQMFQAIIEDRNAPKVEKSIDGYSGFLFYDDNGMPLVAMHWQHRFNHMVGRYNDIYRVQMPNITPHVCRHTYCSNMAKSGMNPKTLQYLMGHSDISVTMNVYTHIGFDDAEEELKRMEEFRKAQAEVDKKNDAKAVSQKMFKVV